MPGHSDRPDGALRPDGASVAGRIRHDDPGGLRPTLSGNRWRDLRAGESRVEGVFPAQRRDDGRSEAVPGGGQRAPGAGNSDGGTVGQARRRTGDGGPDFARTVPPGGYAWWYVDALSDDGRQGLTVIAFVGSVFSPYYAWSGRRDPENHCAINVALYGAGSDRWAMTERGRGALRRTSSTFAVGRSALHWSRTGLTLDLDERSVPHLSPIRGTVSLTPDCRPGIDFALDSAGRHRWWPVAPMARVSVELERPRTSWRGHGYFDSNWGSEPLEAAFRRWDWSRFRGRDSALILYDADLRAGGDLSMALRFGADGGLDRLTPPPHTALPAGRWRVERGTRSDGGDAVSVSRRLEDSPFYTREILDTHLYGERGPAVHESLDLDRFASPIVKLMLPFRMPRAAFG